MIEKHEKKMTNASSLNVYQEKIMIFWLGSQIFKDALFVISFLEKRMRLYASIRSEIKYYHEIPIFHKSMSNGILDI